jgi:hypothetical protein
MNKVGLCGFALFAVVALSGADRDTVLQWGRQHTTMFYDGKFDAIWKNFSPDMQTMLGSKEALSKFQEQVVAQLGKETTIVSETVSQVADNDVYLRIAKFEKQGLPIRIQWSFDEKGVATGFYVKADQKEAPTDFLDYETKTALRLPFEGDWHVFWGGRSLEENYHAAYPDQRFAYDIVIMKGGSTHTGNGQQNEAYFCFGKPIVAPGDGRVHAAENDVKDNKPGEMNPAEAMGNHVIIEHGNGEFSFLAHFKQGSVRVKPGDKVRAGDLLGHCGNSGNTSEPHIHYHLQNTREFNAGEGLPAQFQDYTADGKPVERGEPVKGQVIAPGEPVTLK